MKQEFGFRAPPKPAETAAVFVRVPVADADRLTRAARESGRPKSRIVADLLSGLGPGGLEVGRADFVPPPTAPEVLTLEEAAAFLRVEPAALQRLADRGEAPGRLIGRDWRFSRAALLDWLVGRPPAPTRPDGDG